ncbi:MAG: hypothetical protein EOO38_20920 [Cytophagaceae bacterium]|nr:MAG: hypothetical protein EOO38_20920 [Cytophagaceae bacterium]
MKQTIKHTSTDKAATVNDPRWAKVVERDNQVDGEFYYAVITTGIYCKPSCTSRLARPENVTFFSTFADAEEIVPLSIDSPALRCLVDDEDLISHETR